MENNYSNLSEHSIKESIISYDKYLKLFEDAREKGTIFRFPGNIDEGFFIRAKEEMLQELINRRVDKIDDLLD